MTDHNADKIKLEDWFESYVAHFLSEDESIRKNIEIKLKHTRCVCAEIADLCESLNLSPEISAFAESLALLHDVGRFEQYKRYGTFSDLKSEDHAVLGIRTLEKHRVLDFMSSQDKDLAYRCIANHNRLSIPESETEPCSFFSRLLRDADKLDIWSVVIEHYAMPEQMKNPALELDLPKSTDICEEVVASVEAGCLVRLKDIRTTADFRILQMSWVFDLNFQRTFKLVDERKYLEKIVDSMPGNVKAGDLYQRIRRFLDEKIASSAAMYTRFPET